MGRATVLEPGVDRWSVASEGTLTSPTLVESTPTNLPFLNAQVGYHRGMAPRLEVGARAWGFGWPRYFVNFGVAADMKWQIATGRPVLALGASLGYARPALGGQPWHIGTLDVPLFIGFDVGTSQAVISPRLGGYVVGSYGQNTLATGSLGLGLGWAFRAGPLDIMPELIYRWSPVGFSGANPDPEQLGVSGLELGAGVSW